MGNNYAYDQSGLRIFLSLSNHSLTHSASVVKEMAQYSSIKVVMFIAYYLIHQKHDKVHHVKLL